MVETTAMGIKDQEVQGLEGIVGEEHQVRREGG